MKSKNEIIEAARRKRRMYAYEVARILGISVSTYERMMRTELPAEQQKEIARKIKDAELD